MEREGWGREGCGAPQPGDAQLLGLLFARGKSDTPPSSQIKGYGGASCSWGLGNGLVGWECCWGSWLGPDAGVSGSAELTV